MLTVALAALSLSLAVALGVAVLLWRATVLDVTAQARTIRRQCEVIHRYRDEFFGIADIATPPPTAAAALLPDDPSLLPDEIEQWLRARTPTIRPAAPDTEDPR